MIEQDTIRLMRECDAGIKMGVSAIDEVIESVKSDALRGILESCREQHCKLQDEIQILLDEYQDDGKEPNAMAKGMTWMKTNMKMMIDASDETIADLMTNGCNMGVKSLSRYLNQYKAASERTKDIAKKLIKLEETLVIDVREYL